MEHSQDVDVVSPDDVENSIGSLRHHPYLEQVGTGDDNARPGELGQLEGTARNSVDHAVGIEARRSAEVSVNCGEMRFGRFGPQHLHAALLRQAVIRTDLLHRAGLPRLLRLEARLNRLADVDLLHNVVPGCIVGQRIGDSSDFLFDGHVETSRSDCTAQSEGAVSLSLPRPTGDLRAAWL